MQLSTSKEIAYGAAAGCLGKAIEFPFDTVKVRLQASPGHASTAAVIRSIFVQEGLFNGFYKGLRAPLLGACMESAILFSAYEKAQAFFRRHTALPPTAVVTSCLSGSVSGLAASFVLTPVELIKCNLQMANLHSPGASYVSMSRRIVRQHGLRGLWSGLSSTVVREMAGTAVWFAAYEQSGLWYRKMWPESGSVTCLMSGATAGFLFNLSIYPVDTLKSNIQTAYASAHEPAQKRSMLATLRLLVGRPGGVRNLYNGLGITLLRSLPANAAIFFSYEWMKANW